jgi:hypothetical protein
MLVGYGYPYAYGIYGKSAPCVNAANVPVPCATGYANYGYAAYGYAPYAAAGLWGRKRREAEPAAEAEADPALLYGAYGYPYAYAGAAYPYAAAAYPYAAGVYANAGLPHAVAATPYGAVHSSLVGVCTNYLGVQVSC